MTENAQALLELRDAVMHRWVEQVREKVKLAERLSPPILINTLPAFFEHIAEAINTSGEILVDANVTNSFAQEHGGERARLSFYDYDQLIQEYYILRQALFDVAKEKGLKLSNEERVIIHRSIDVAIKDAAMGFALVQANIREQFMATLTHDLRNPLSAIKMASQMAAESVHSPEEVATLLQIVVQNADRADHMIQDLLDASLVSAGARLNLRIAECDLHEVAHKTLAPLTVVHGARLQLRAAAGKGYCDANALRRALENLVMNAIKYGRSDSPVTLTLTIQFGRAIFSVHNEGEPIPIDEREAIFQVFRRRQAEKSRTKQGWGLGLALVRGVAEAHGGSIVVESSAEQGTTFILDIPVDARPFQNTETT
jgi:signal transduction histidine kinase